MSASTNLFIWYELMTSDATAAEAFYRSVIGWKTADAGMPDMKYTLLSVAESAIAGLMNLPAEASAAGARPGWLGSIAVDDVDARLAQLLQAGGAMHHPARDIPGVGRFATVADPPGAVFCLFKGDSSEPPPQPASGTPGTMGWHELYAGDLDSAWAFYSALFGWTKDETIDMGQMCLPVVCRRRRQPGHRGHDDPPARGAAAWLAVLRQCRGHRRCCRTHQRRRRQVVSGPMEVPGGSYIVQCLDPQGAMFAMVALKR